MLTKRIIPCLDIKDGRTVKGVNFVELRDAGDAVEQGAIYAQEGADELVFLDIFATVQNRKTRLEWVRRVCEVGAPRCSVFASQFVGASEEGELGQVFVAACCLFRFDDGGELQHGNLDAIEVQPLGSRQEILIGPAGANLLQGVEEAQACL